MHCGWVGPWHRDLGAWCQLHLQLDPHEILHSWSMMCESELRALNALFTLQTASLEPGGKPPVPPTGAGLCHAVPCCAVPAFQRLQTQPGRHRRGWEQEDVRRLKENPPCRIHAKVFA